MRKLNAAIAALVVLITLTAFYGASSRKGAQELNINLEDGAVYSYLDLDHKLYDNQHVRGNTDYSRSNLFFNVDTLATPGSATLEPFATENNNARDLVTYVNRISLGRWLGYQNAYDRKSTNGGTVTDYSYAFLDTAGYMDDTKSEKFGEYYHSLFSAKSARTVLFNEALGIVHNLTKKYPADFKKRVVAEIDSLIVFTRSLPKRKYSEAKAFNAYWEGFIYRRHFVDKVPVSEIEQSLKKAKATLSPVKPPSDHAYKVTFNGEFTVYSSAGMFILSSGSGKKELTFNGALEGVKYVKGKGYEITYTDKNWKLMNATYTAQLKKI